MVNGGDTLRRHSVTDGSEGASFPSDSRYRFSGGLWLPDSFSQAGETSGNSPAPDGAPPQEIQDTSDPRAAEILLITGLYLIGIQNNSLPELFLWLFLALVLFHSVKGYINDFLRAMVNLPVSPVSADMQTGRSDANASPARKNKLTGYNSDIAGICIILAVIVYAALHRYIDSSFLWLYLTVTFIIYGGGFVLDCLFNIKKYIKSKFSRRVRR